MEYVDFAKTWLVYITLTEQRTLLIKLVFTINTSRSVSNDSTAAAAVV